MVVYIPMIVATTLLIWLAKHVKRNQRVVVLIMAIAIPVTVATLRYNNGADYLMYLRMMKLAEQTGSSATAFTKIKSIESGYWLLLKLCGGIWPGQYFMTYGVIAIIICGFCYIAIWQQSPNPALSVYLFFVSGIYFDSFNGLRQYIAVAITVFAYKYIQNGELKKYLVAVIIASLFHYSALLVIPAYFIRYIKIDLKKACIIVVGCLAGGTIIFNLVSTLLSFTRYKYFLTSVEYEAQATTSTILFTTVVSLISYGYIAYKKKNVSERFQQMMSFQILPWCSAVLSITIPLAWRVQYYFMFFEVIYIPAFLLNVENKKTRLVFATVFVTMYTAITIWGMTQNDWYIALPYNYYFNYM